MSQDASDSSGTETADGLVTEITRWLQALYRDNPLKFIAVIGVPIIIGAALGYGVGTVLFPADGAVVDQDTTGFPDGANASTLSPKIVNTHQEVLLAQGSYQVETTVVAHKQNTTKKQTELRRVNYKAETSFRRMSYSGMTIESWYGEGAAYTRRTTPNASWSYLPASQNVNLTNPKSLSEVRNTILTFTNSSKGSLSYDGKSKVNGAMAHVYSSSDVKLQNGATFKTVQIAVTDDGFITKFHVVILTSKGNTVEYTIDYTGVGSTQPSEPSWVDQQYNQTATPSNQSG